MSLSSTAQGDHLNTVPIPQRRRYTSFPANSIKPLTVRRTSEILSMQFDPRDNLLSNGYLTKGNSLSIVGMGGIGKSRVVLQLAIASILGRPFFGWKTYASDSHWLILQTENGNRRLKGDLERMTAELTQGEMDKLDAALFIHTIEHDEDAHVCLAHPEGLQRVTDVISTYRPDVVVYDVLRDFSSGDLNSDQFMTEACRAISSVTRRGNAQRIPLVLHHALTGRAGAAKATGFDRGSFGRNSKVLQGWTRAQINLAPYNSDSNDVIVVASGKANDCIEFDPFAVRLNPNTLIYERDENVDLSLWRDRVLNGGEQARKRVGVKDVQRLVATPDGKSIRKKEIVTKLIENHGISSSKAYSLVTSAEANGLIQPSGRGSFISADPKTDLLSEAG
jgi:hypothetical protein